jgi:hypothetical protein
MWEIFKRKTGKDFYKDSIAFYAYDPHDNNDDCIEEYHMDDDELSYYIIKKYKL